MAYGICFLKKTMDDIAKASSAEGKMAEMYQLTHRPVSCFCSQEFYIWQFWGRGGLSYVQFQLQVVHCYSCQYHIVFNTFSQLKILNVYVSYNINTKKGFFSENQRTAQTNQTLL